MYLWLDWEKVGRRLRTAKALGIEVHYLPGFEHNLYVKTTRRSSVLS